MLAVRRIAISLLLGPIGVALLGVAARAEDWPQFRGPTGQGHSTERGVPIEWSESRNVVWRTPIPGRGWSSPVVAGGRVWVTTATQGGGASLRALAFDAESGREVVNVEVFRIRSADLSNPKNSHASPTPIVDGDRVYVHFGAEGTAAITTSGEIVWKTKFPYESQHGNGGSPVLYGDLLILSCDGSNDAFVVALDTRTGKVRWKTPRRQPFDQAYSTPLVIRVGDRDEAGFQEPSLLAVRVDGTGDVTRTHIAWARQRAAPLTPSPLLAGDELYIVNDVGIASCLNAKTGEAYWVQRLGGNYSASPVLADGRIYFLSEEGAATVIAAGKEFRKLATNVIDGETLASMAVSNGSIFIRTDSQLYRIGERRSRDPGF